ncbi:MAG: carboxypeptidase-like regulatory domain-containing protein [Candidatus Micrarchaeota archaeon]
MGKQAALLLALVCLCWASSALTIGPMIYEQKDLGDIGLSEFTYSLSADCNASTISAYIFNETNRPVRDANIYLKYVDFSSPLMSNTKTDKDGYSLIRLPGNVKLMRGLFIMVVEKKGYRNKEIHFDLSPCWGGNPIPPKPNQTMNTTNATNQTGPPKPPSNNSTSIPPANASGNQTPGANGTGNGTGNGGAEPASPICPSAMAITGLSLLVLILGCAPKCKSASFFKSFKPS